MITDNRLHPIFRDIFESITKPALRAWCDYFGRPCPSNGKCDCVVEPEQDDEAQQNGETK